MDTEHKLGKLQALHCLDSIPGHIIQLPGEIVSPGFSVYICGTFIPT